MITSRMPVLFEDWLRLLRSRWIIICVSLVVAVLGAIVITWRTTPLYEASTRLFVSTTPVSGESYLSEIYAGASFSQERIKSYTALLKGETLHQRTIEKLGPQMSDMTATVHASAETGTVLIDLRVVDESPIRARDFANAMSEEFVIMVEELETREGSTLSFSGVIVEQAATAPEKPVVPKKELNLTIGVLAGLLLGIGLAVIRELFDKTVKDSGPLEAITGAKLVGSIPFDKKREKEPATDFDSEDDARTAEAFRKLRTHVQFLSTDNPPHVIVVASPMPSEGKSTTAINLALALVEAGQSVLLLDADMRRPTLAGRLNLVDSVGLSTVLTDQASLDEALQESSFPGLTVLAAGVAPSNPSELLGSMAAKRLFSEVRARFDFVIVNSPPLLAVTDPAVLAVNADGVLLLARFGKTTRGELAHATRNLKDLGASIFGTVFTMVPEASEPYSYSYGYYEDDDDDKAQQPSRHESPTKPVTVNPPPPGAESGRHRRANPKADQSTGADGANSVDSADFNELSVQYGNGSEAVTRAEAFAALAGFEVDQLRKRSREGLTGLTTIPETLSRLKFALHNPRVPGPYLGVLFCGIDQSEAINT
ncbi:MAG: polysaccharide biosynthesis tyrosine autokinase, partial [Actinomycetia bacterium]|nr:polysaccharide biosynthesis tyrosine autokinase [Actinomycetes bacterium]